MSMTPLPGEAFFSFPSWLMPKTADNVETLVKSADMGRYCFILKLDRLIL